MIKKFFAIAVMGMVLASCSSNADKLIDKINACKTPEEAMEVAKNKELQDMYKELTPEEKKKVDEASDAKMKELTDAALEKASESLDLLDD